MVSLVDLTTGVASRLPGFKRVSVVEDVSYEGEEILRVDVVLASVDKIGGDEFLGVLMGLHGALWEVGDDRFPLISYYEDG